MLNNSGGPVLRSPGERLTVLIEGPNFHFLGSGNFGRIAVHRAAAFAVNHEFRVENFEVRIDKIFARDGLHVALADRFWAPAGNLSLGDMNGENLERDTDLRGRNTDSVEIVQTFLQGPQQKLDFWTRNSTEINVLCLNSQHRVANLDDMVERRSVVRTFRRQNIWQTKAFRVLVKVPEGLQDSATAAAKSDDSQMTYEADKHF